MTLGELEAFLSGLELSQEVRWGLGSYGGLITDPSCVIFEPAANVYVDTMLREVQEAQESGYESQDGSVVIGWSKDTRVYVGRPKSPGLLLTLDLLKIMLGA